MTKKIIAILIAVLFVPSLLLAQQYPSPTYKDVTVQQNLNLPSKPANQLLIAPDGVAGMPAFRVLVPGDIPALDASKITTGTLPVARGGTGVTTSTGTGNTVLSASPTLTGSPIITGSNIQLNDIGRTSQTDNNAAFTITSSEGVGFPSYVTNYGLIVDRTMTATGEGDRIGAGFYQTCEATDVGKSCVGSALVSVASGTALGNYTGGNSIVKVPPGLTGPAGVAVGLEIDTQTHSPVGIKNGLRIADENMYGAVSTAGSIQDSAIVITTSNAPATPSANLGYNIGLQFGEAAQGYPQNWPIRANGTLIQAIEPTTVIDFGLDFTGMSAGFTYAALAMPVNETGNGIRWGYNRVGGEIKSTGTATAPQMTFTDSGIFFQDAASASIAAIWNTGRMQMPLQTPSSSSAACVTGQFMNDANYYYVCTATNTWKRAALSAF